MRKSFWVVSILSFALICADSVLDLDCLHNVAKRFGSPIEYGLYRSGYSLNRFVNFLSDVPYVYRDNLNLNEELVNYFALQVRYEQLLEENQVLRRQLKVQTPKDRNSLLAYVLGIDTQRGPGYIIIDKGQQDGVAINQIAHVAGSLVGRVVETRAYQSVV